MATHNICFHEEIRKIYIWMLLLSEEIRFVERKENVSFLEGKTQTL